MKKVWNIARMTKMWHKDRKWANAVGKVLLIKWLNTQGGHTSSIYRRHDTTKHDKAKHNKTSCACIHVHILSNSFSIPVLGMSKDKDKSTGQWRQSGDTCRQTDTGKVKVSSQVLTCLLEYIQNWNMVLRVKIQKQPTCFRSLNLCVITRSKKRAMVLKK